MAEKQGDVVASDRHPHLVDHPALAPEPQGDSRKEGHVAEVEKPPVPKVDPKNSGDEAKGGDDVKYVNKPDTDDGLTPLERADKAGKSAGKAVNRAPHNKGR